MTTPTKTPTDDKPKSTGTDEQAAGAAKEKDTRPETASTRAETDRMPRKSMTGFAPRIADEEKPPIFASELQRDNYYRELDERQRKRDEAWRDVPPGTTIRVATARGIQSRRRAGIDFSPTGITVEVVDTEKPAELEKIRGTGVNAVGPEGGKAILDDDGLISFRGGDAASAEANDARVQDLEHQISALRAENARLRSGGDVQSGERSNPFGEKIEGKLANPTRRTPA